MIKDLVELADTMRALFRLRASEISVLQESQLTVNGLHALELDIYGGWE